MNLRCQPIYPPWTPRLQKIVLKFRKLHFTRISGTAPDKLYAANNPVWPACSLLIPIPFPAPSRIHAQKLLSEPDTLKFDCSNLSCSQFIFSISPSYSFCRIQASQDRNSQMVWKELWLLHLDNCLFQKFRTTQCPTHELLKGWESCFFLSMLLLVLFIF